MTAELNAALATILNAVVSGDLVPRADVEGLVGAAKVVAEVDASPEYNGRYIGLRHAIAAMRPHLTALENRNG